VYTAHIICCAGMLTSVCPSLANAPEGIAALLPVVNAVSEAATALQVKYQESTRSLASMSKEVEHLNAALLESQAETDHLQHGLRSQLQQFHQALESVKSETRAAQKTAQVRNK